VDVTDLDPGALYRIFRARKMRHVVSGLQGAC
jgi:hypothetical protein